MKTLFLDTAWKNLIVALFEDGELVEGECQEAFKRQSETLFVTLKALLEKAHWTLQDIDQVIVTNGPGSYTGLRLALTSAKILGSQANIPVSLLTTFQLYSGKAKKANVLLDARGNRAYVGHIEEGKVEWMGILPLEEIPAFLESHPGDLYGEGELIGQEASASDFLQNVKDLLPLASPVNNIHSLSPLYMKESDSYKAS